MMDTMTAPKVATQDFLTVADLSAEELVRVLDFADHLKGLRKDGREHHLLKGKSIAMYFEKPSNRTRVSFEVGIFDLGAHPVMLRKDEVNLGVRETISDTARTLSRYVDAIMIRTFAQRDVNELAHHASVPVINGLTDEHHPCQILADLQTARERFGDLKGRKLCFIGDGNNIAHSLMEGCALMGMHFSIACPQSHNPLPDIVENARKIGERTGAEIQVTDDIITGVKGAAVVYTDVWTSMGQEQESIERQRVFEGFQVNADVMQAAADAIVLHCLPAHRGEEITADVFEAHAQSIFDQAENRMHAQKAIMAALLVR